MASVSYRAAGSTNLAFCYRRRGASSSGFRLEMPWRCCRTARTTPDLTPSPFAARLPRLDVLLDTSGEGSPTWAVISPPRPLQLRQIRTYRDAAPALSGPLSRPFQTARGRVNVPHRRNTQGSGMFRQCPFLSQSRP